MAAAIILIPEMLSGPERAEDGGEQIVERVANGSGLKTYTIELNDPSGTQTRSVPDERVPPREQPAPESRASEAPSAQAAAVPALSSAARDELNPKRGAENAPTPPQATTISPSKPAEPPKPAEPARTQPPAQAASEPRSRPVATNSGVPTSQGWAVQLGSFSNGATAERLAAEFRATRRDVFVMPVKSGGTTLYRVRIGPMKDRAAAEAVLRQVRAKVSGAVVVTHP